MGKVLRRDARTRLRSTVIGALEPDTEFDPGVATITQLLSPPGEHVEQTVVPLDTSRPRPVIGGS